MSALLETGGRRRLILSSALLFLIVFAFVILKSARDALFLSRYSSRSLPYFMAMNTAVSTAAAAISLRVYKWINLNKLVQWSLFLFSAGTFLFWEGFTASHLLLPALFYLWVGVVGTIAPVQGWSLVSQQFSTRQAKRGLGVAGAGATLGAIAGGFFAGLFAGAWNAVTLIAVAGLVLVIASAGCAPLSAAASSEESVAGAQQDLPVRKRFRILLVSLIAVATIVSTCVDFQFKTLAQQHARSAEDLAKFFGSFYAFTGLATLLLEIMVIPTILRRLGVAGSLLTSPLCLSIINGVFLATGSFNSGVTLRAGEEVLRHSVSRSSLEALYLAIPEQARIRLKTFADTIAVRGPEFLASGMLILLFSIADLSFHLLSILIMGFLGVWFVCAWILGQSEYPQVLKERIDRKDIDFESLKENLFTGQFYRLLPEFFAHAEREMVLNLLDLVELSGKSWLGRYLLLCLDREEPEIRLRALRLLFDQEANVSDRVSLLMAERNGEIKREAVHYLCLRSTVNDVTLQKLAADPDPAVQAAGCAAVLRNRWRQRSGYQKLTDLIEESIHQHRPDVREEIAHVLEYSKPSDAALPLYVRLLQDESDDVRKAALKCIVRTRPQGAISELLLLSRNPALKTQVRAAIAGYGDRLIPLLARIAENRAAPDALRKLAVDAASDIGERSCDFLLRIARQENLAIRFNAIKALNRLKKRNQLIHASPALTSLLRKEMQLLKRDVWRARAFAPKTGSLAERILSQRIHWSQERIFRLLGLLYEPDSIYFAYLAWNSPDTHRSDAALEWLEQTVDPEIAKSLFPLLETHSEPETKPDSQGEERKKAFLACLLEKEPLLASAVIRDLTARELKEWETEIKRGLSASSHPLVAETISWRYRAMNPDSRTLPEQTLTAIQKMEHLSKINVFQKLGTQELLLLADLAQETPVESGQTICTEGQIPFFFSLFSGQMRLKLPEGESRIIEAGESIGMLELLTDRSFRFSCTADQPSLGLTIDRDSFLEILEDQTAVCLGILDTLAQRLNEPEFWIFGFEKKHSRV